MSIKRLILRWIFSALSLWLVSYVISGIEVSSPLSLIIAALVIGILNAILKPILLILTLPLTILTFGLFTFILNALMIYIAGQVVNGFVVENLLSAFVAAILLAIFNSLFNMLI